MGVFKHVILTFIIVLETEARTDPIFTDYSYYDVFYFTLPPSNSSASWRTRQQTNSRTTMSSKKPNVFETEARTDPFSSDYSYYDVIYFTLSPSNSSASRRTRQHTNSRTTMSSKEPNDCFSDTTTNYEGKQNTTMSDHTCLRWDSSLIPIDERFRDTDFPVDGSVQQANNYCRDPDKSGALWCYTTNPDVKKDKCSIDKCEQTGITTFLAEFEDDVWMCRFPTTGCKEDEQLVCYNYYISYTTTFEGVDCNMYFCCYKRGCIDVPSSEYAGRWSNSMYYSECLRWDTITSIPLSGSSFPEGSIADANNYCRDPENLGLPYCFVQEGDRLYCGIPTCSELASRHIYSHDCYQPTSSDRIGLGSDVTDDEICLLDPDRIVIDSDKLRAKYPGCRECSCCQIQKCYKGESQHYNGTWSRTISGRECRSWVELDSLTYSDYYGITPLDSENYCRDFLWYGYTYCYTKDLNMEFEACYLKMECLNNPQESTLSVVIQDHTNPSLQKTTARSVHKASEITTQKSQPLTKTSFTGYSTSEPRLEQYETTEWPPSKAPAKLANLSFLLCSMLSLHLF